ncbi:MAG TPA: hypothetical protein PLZ51_21785, partial [Aggregatilineales bacterium]|nr:hypothetical protein [Aggregatilineales bacterium]
YTDLQRQVIEQDILARYPELTIPQDAIPPENPDSPARIFIDRPPPFPFLRPEDILILLLGIGVIVGILGGIIMSKRLSAPLSNLADVARKFGER